ncbi:S1C family serine protease [bacterium]|nr:S1C family serine protease [bacterium]
MHRLAVLLALFGISPAAAGSPSVSPDSIRGAGTAWPTASGYVVTNHHLVAGREDIVLVDANGRAFRARVVGQDPENDVAVLDVADSSELPPGLPIGTNVLRLGAGVFTLGFPRIDVMGTSPKLSQGIVSGLTGILDDPNGFLMSVPIQPGNSGGPLLDMSGRVVGMVTSMVAAPTGTGGELLPLPSVNCAVRADVVAALLAGLPVRRGSGVTPSGDGDLESLVARVERSVLIVMAR